MFLSTMRFIYGKGKHFQRRKQLQLTDRGVLYVIFDHPDFVHTRESATSKKAVKREIFLYAIKCGIDEAIQKLFEFRYTEGQLDIDEIRGIKDKHDAMYYDAVLSA